MKPYGRSLGDFGILSSAEKELLKHCHVGTVAKIAVVRPKELNGSNKIRAEFLRFLLLGGDNKAPVHEHGVQLCGAYIEGSLSLKATNISYAIGFENCTFEIKPDFTDASVANSFTLDNCASPGIEGRRLIVGGKLSMRRLESNGTVNLQGSQIGGSLACTGAILNGSGADALSVDGAVIKESLFLNNGFNALGRVRLLGAQIGATLDCSGANLDGKDGVIFSADRIVVKGSVFLTGGFKATGSVSLIGAQIGGSLNCAGASLDGKDECALSVDNAVIENDVLLSKGFKSLGGVRLLGVKIGGMLSCSGSSFDGKNKDALSLDNAVVKGSVFLRGHFKSMGKVGLLGAQIGGSLECGGASFDGNGGAAFSADRVFVRGSVFLSHRLTAIGRVHFLGAHIEGSLNCHNASFDGNNEDAFSADRAVVKGSVFLKDGFKAVGTVRLVGMHVGGEISCHNASFDGKGGDAFSADRVVVKGSVFMSKGFKAVGTVRLMGAKIEGQLSCLGASFDGLDGVALKVDRMCVNGSFILCELKLPLKNSSFVRAEVAVLNDDEKSWGDNLVLDGFVYSFLSGDAPGRAAPRIAWLNKQKPLMAGGGDVIGTNKDFRPQPWRQLQKVLAEMGHAEEAREVGIAFEQRLRQAGLIGQSPESWPSWRRWAYSQPARILHFLYGELTGFGYQPTRLLLWFFLMWFTCTGIYWYAAAREGVFAPTNPIVFQHDDYFHCRPDRESVWLQRSPAAAGLAVREIPKNLKGSGNWYLCPELREEYTGFSPLAFSLDILLPLVDLQQQKDWAPMIPTPKAGFFEELTSFGWKHFIRILIWFETLFGWLVSLLLVAIVSGLAKRKD